MNHGLRSLLLAGVAAALLQAPPGFAADAPAVKAAPGGLAAAASDLAAKVARVAGPDVTPQQGAAAEAAVREWLASLLGSSLKVPEHPVQLTPDGNHFAARIVFLHRDAAAGGDVVLTGNAYPMDGGKWHVEDIRFVSPVVYTIDMPVPAKDGTNGSPKAPATTRPVTFTTTTVGQDGQLDFDPSFATTTRLTGTLKSLTGHAEGQGLNQNTTIGPLDSLTTISPAGPGRVDVAMSGTMHDYRLDSMSGDTPPFHVEIGTIGVKGGMVGVSRDKAMAITQMVVAMASSTLNVAASAGGAPNPPLVPSKQAQQMVPALLAALQDSASGMDLTETFEDIAVKAGGLAGGMEKLGFGMAGKSVDGILQASLDLDMEGLALPSALLAGMDSLVPTKVAMRPFISGIAVADLVRMAKAENDSQSPSPDDIMALFSHGGITSGLESMTVELGGATFTGQAKVVATAPDPSALSGTGQIVAEDFDDLVTKVQATPALAQGIPVLILAKGIGRKVGDTLVWDITYKDGKVLVNNLDLTAMAGTGSPPPAAAPGPGGAVKRPAPARPAR